MSDAEIVALAKARAGFKGHLVVYVLVNTLLFSIWLVMTLVPSLRPEQGGYYWPIWPHLGWGLGLAIHWFFAFGPGQQMQAREEQRLREKYG